jgi:hypothetical protein
MGFLFFIRNFFHKLSKRKKSKNILVRLPNFDVTVLYN